MVIYLDRYRATSTAPASVSENGAYGAEISSADWNPAPASPSPSAAKTSGAWLESLTAGDADAMLAAIYALATLV
ncbi:MAG TPA: hypothetical protein VMT94_06990 [Burkholderiales bacterium]|nr:hypothetical protein [Burkholderiales bacterium]